MNLMTVGGEDLTLFAQFAHLGATSIPSYSWVSGTPGTATVTPVGNGSSATVHAVAAGTTTITLTAGSMSSTFVLKVVAAPVARVMIGSMPQSGQAFPNDTGGQQINPNPN